MSDPQPANEDRPTGKRGERDDQLATRLHWLLGVARQLRQLAEDWAEGFPEQTGGGSGSGGSGPSNPTARLAARNVRDVPDRLLADGVTPNPDWMPPVEGDGLAARAAALAASIEALRREINRLSRDAARLLPVSQRSAQLLANQQDPRFWGAGTCQRTSCGRWTPGVDEDRLKAGYCPRCYRAWDRAGRPDRAQFNRTGPQAVPTKGDGVSPGALTRGAAGVPCSASGGEVSADTTRDDVIPDQADGET